MIDDRLGQDITLVLILDIVPVVAMLQAGLHSRRRARGNKHSKTAAITEAI